MGIKSGAIVLLVKPHDSYKELYDEMFEELQSLPIPVDVKEEYYLPQEKM